MQFENLTNDPKIKQFLDQLNELADYYQFELRAVLKFSTAGIVPALEVKPKIPDKKPLPEPQAITKKVRVK